MTKPAKPVIVALDFPSFAEALSLVDKIDPSMCRVKVGKELFTRAGPDSVAQLNRRGFEVFLDLKFHDIPNTVAGACRAAADLGCWMVNVHAGGGRAMLDAAVDAFARLQHAPQLIGVTVLTNLDSAALVEVGVLDNAQTQVLRLAKLANECGLDGVVCSPLEITSLRQHLAADFVLVTPGVRPLGAQTDDQRRTATPAAALAQGANFLVVGRPITRAPDPALALAAINAECQAALA